MNLLMASFAQIASYAGYVLLAILVLHVMITVHELGHYIAGKIFHFKITEFAIGFGPKIFKRQKKDGEKFSIRLLPIGGFCSFLGEDGEEKDPGAFNNKKPWQRIIVLISGALMNYILALLIIILTFSVYGQSFLQVNKTEHDQGVSIERCLIEGDVILTANGKNVYLANDLLSAISGRKKGDTVQFKVKRAGEEKIISVALQTDTDFKNMEDYVTMCEALGVKYKLNDQTGAFEGYYLSNVSLRLGFFQIIFRAFEYSFSLALMVFKVLGELLTGAIGLSSLGGTVTTITMTAQAIQVGGFRYLLNIASLIGVNLAVFNLLPIPALDGSRALFTAIEWVRGKPINRRIESILHGVGLVLLLLFAVIVDLQRCF